MLGAVLAHMPARLWPALLPYLAFEGATAVVAFVSPRAAVVASGWYEAVVPFMATWLWVVGFWLLHGRALGVAWVDDAGFGLSLCGYAIGTWAVASLGTAFSVLPEVRRLVARGPYRFVRHPIYLAYFLVAAGALVVRPSPALMTVAVIWAWLMWLRLRMEERKLAAFLSGYAEYAARTGTLLPRLSGPRPAAEQ